MYGRGVWGLYFSRGGCGEYILAMAFNNYNGHVVRLQYLFSSTAGVQLASYSVFFYIFLILVYKIPRFEPIPLELLDLWILPIVHCSE
jgi:hypothetical protein